MKEFIRNIYKNKSILVGKIIIGLLLCVKLGSRVDDKLSVCYCTNIFDTGLEKEINMDTHSYKTRSYMQFWIITVENGSKAAVISFSNSHFARGICNNSRKDEFRALLLPHRSLLADQSVGRLRTGDSTT